jgi:hypothetical protein
MLPTLGTKLKPHAFFVHQNDVFSPGNMADLGYWNAGDVPRYLLAARSREEQFVIFASVQGGLKLNFVGGPADGGEGYGLCTNLSPNSTFLTNVSEVGGEAVADVKHGGSQAPLAKELSDGDTGPWAKVLREVSGMKSTARKEYFQRRRGSAERASHVDAIAGFSARAQYGLTPRTGPDNDDISEDPARGLGNVAASEVHLKRIGLVQQAVEKPVNPVLRQVSRQGQGQKRGNGPASHGGNVAQSAGKAAMADNFGSVPLAPEMNPFKAEIRGHERFVSGGDSQGGAVVADANADRGAALCTRAHSLDDRLFAQRQANSIYKRRAR